MKLPVVVASSAAPTTQTKLAFASAGVSNSTGVAVEKIETDIVSVPDIDPSDLAPLVVDNQQQQQQQQQQKPKQVLPPAKSDVMLIYEIAGRLKLAVDFQVLF